MAIIPVFYMNAVASIGVRQGEYIAWIGTGFFIYRKIPGQDRVMPMLITNKHVLAGEQSVVIRTKSKDDEKLHIIDVPLYQDDQPIYRQHSDPDIDIAVIRIDGTYLRERHIEFNGFDIDNNALSSPELRDAGVDEGSLIYMLGFPMGMVNVNDTLPICRLGCIARISDAQICESHNLLADIQNFPGNSGSPIITRPEMVSIEGTNSLDRAVLAGIVHSYIPYTERLINQQTNKLVELRSENSGIALVHPVEYIREVVDDIFTVASGNAT